MCSDQLIPRPIPEKSRNCALKSNWSLESLAIFRHNMHQYARIYIQSKKSPEQESHSPLLVGQNKRRSRISAGNRSCTCQQADWKKNIRVTPWSISPNRLEIASFESTNRCHIIFFYGSNDLDKIMPRISMHALTPRNPANETNDVAVTVLWSIACSWSVLIDEYRSEFLTHLVPFFAAWTQLSFQRPTAPMAWSNYTSWWQLTTGWFYRGSGKGAKDVWTRRHQSTGDSLQGLSNSMEQTLCCGRDMWYMCIHLFRFNVILVMWECWLVLNVYYTWYIFLCGRY